MSVGTTTQGPARTGRPTIATPRVIRIRVASPDQPTVYCIPGAGASGISFLPFAEEMDSANIFAFHPRGLDGLDSPHESVEDAARYYFPDAQLAARRGPIMLVGHSFGGWIAHELACLLESSGLQVAPLLLLDAEHPQHSFVRKSPFSSSEVICKFRRLAQRTAGSSFKTDPSTFALLESTEQLSTLLAEMQEARILPKTATTSFLEALTRSFGINVNTNYAPTSRLQCGAHLLLADEDDPDDPDYVAPESITDGWTNIIPQLMFDHVPGNHASMLKTPHVQRIAEIARTIWF